MAGSIERLFVTSLYRAPLRTRALAEFVRELARSCEAIARADVAGQRWSRRHGYAGYTSYASLDDLPWRDPVIAELVRHLDRHVARFARATDMDLGSRPLELDSLWINRLDPGGMHPGHIHPHSIVSGTVYVALPPGASGLKFEDPRSGLMMAAPTRRAGARRQNLGFVEVKPEPGDVLLWESWLRHEVPPTRSARERVTVSFNYGQSGVGQRE